MSHIVWEVISLLKYEKRMLEDEASILKREDAISDVMDHIAPDIADGLLNPLTSVKGLVQFLASQTTEPYHDLILSELTRMEFMAYKYLVLASKPLARSWKKQNLRMIFKKTMTMFESHIEFGGLTIKLENADFVPVVEAKGELLQVAFTSMIQYIVQSMSCGGLLRIKMTNDSTHVFVHFLVESVRDDHDHCACLTEIKRLNVSLMAVYKIIAEHNGRIRLTYASQGEKRMDLTSVHIRLPIHHRLSVNVRE